MVTLTIQVKATQPWTDTGLTVSPGSIVTVTASGTLYVGATDPGTPPTGKPTQTTNEGDIAPNLTVFSLIGRLGAGLPSEVGDAHTFVIYRAGRLALGLNDDYFGDNFGSWTAIITDTVR
jgi:hypothetical protein